MNKFAPSGPSNCFVEFELPVMAAEPNGLVAVAAGAENQKDINYILWLYENTNGHLPPNDIAPPVP